jgi:hypothetical protein
MKVEGSSRTTYFKRALFWGIVAIVTALPAFPYLRAFVRFISKGGTDGF